MLVITFLLIGQLIITVVVLAFSKPSNKSAGQS